ncbi:KOW motif-containing protein [Laspinema sp. A4]|uniref:KOW motif-containing protein n=1 Tax=Laspinema sp. D2d TaxID=2953686 RepID=UPI0021BAE609|nr:KOW motif-containing protein [Laspinema sp. D2d]MCT7984968.1 KOW motif-containing protein [Laspinema sp. D2d]
MEGYQLYLDLNVRGIRLESGDRVLILSGPQAGKTGRVSIPRYWAGRDFQDYFVRLRGNKRISCPRHQLHKIK